jgi:TPR repeat protein
VQGHAAAQYNLGIMYRTGEGVEKDAVQSTGGALVAEGGSAGACSSTGQSW